MTGLDATADALAAQLQTLPRRPAPQTLADLELELGGDVYDDDGNLSSFMICRQVRVLFPNIASVTCDDDCAVVKIIERLSWDSPILRYTVEDLDGGVCLEEIVATRLTR